MNPIRSTHDLLPELYQQIKSNRTGEVASYIPELADVNPDLLAISFCDVHGKQTHVGDTSFDFCLQSCSKPLTYCLARMLQVEAEARLNAAAGASPSTRTTTTTTTTTTTADDTPPIDVHAYVGYEPSGRAFNEFALNRDELPHNPLINAGAIMVASLVKPRCEPSDRFSTVLQFYRDMCGHAGRVGFDNGVFLSEKHHADRNLSLAYFMREKGAFAGTPTPSQLMDHLNLYFQCCSVTINTQIGAIMAATLANQGTCPLSSQRVVRADIVKDVLTIMYGCGMYDYSGQFGFEVGLPAKSGVSGCVLLVIPHVGGMCIWSPRLDRQGNSVRGLECCRAFTQMTQSRHHLFGWSCAASLSHTGSSEQERSPDAMSEATLAKAKTGSAACAQGLSSPPPSTDLPTTQTDVSTVPYHAIAAAAAGDMAYLEAVTDTKSLLAADYDGRTPLHLACAEGHVDAVRLLVF